MREAVPTAPHHSTTPPLHYSFTPRLHERGIALVITLILLAVITFMAIAFLVLSSSQRKAVGTSTDQNLAKEGAENALARGMADLMSTIMISTNPFSVNLRVSTNYINDGGFLTKGPARTSVTNVNYYYPNGQIVSGLDAQQNIANLLISPRAPVFVQTNTAGSNDFRFFLDLNRNRLFEPTGWLLVTNLLGLAVPTYVTGDPQWIGGLEFPDRHHSADNQFIYRYAYIIMPASQSLDVNYIYNDATDPNGQMLQDHFLRNQGAGTFEVNLAAFLADLNTNIWYTAANPYMYQTPLPGGAFNRGTAFEDALSLLRYRYASNTVTLDNVTALFGNNGAYALGHDMIDDFSAGPVMTTTWWPADFDLNRINQNAHWAGANNTNHFFTSQDLFDPIKVSPQFAANLQRAGMATNGPPSTALYNRYTLYRLLSQLGTDTDSPSDLTKINLNYDNKARPNALGIISATNFLPWRPIDFFTNTAIALLANAGFAAGSQINVTNVPLLSIDNQGRTNFQIEIWPINNYTPSVHRLLQFAANLFDSTTNRGATYPYFPTVFRPIFRRTTMGGTNFVFITAYQEVVDTSIIAPGNNGGSPWLWLDSGSNTIVSIPVAGTPVSVNPRVEPLVSGVPLIVGAKKGFPNFNEFSEQTYVYVSRLLEFRRDVTGGPVKHTNQMYVASITNTFGLEAWNAYSNPYPRQLQAIIRADMSATVTNELGGPTPLLNTHWTQATNYVIQPGQWPGWTTLPVNGFSFQLPWGTNANFMFLTNASYSSLAGRFIPLTHLFASANQIDTFPVPHWWLNLNTRLRYILVDTTANRIVDYVDLNTWQPTMDLDALLAPPGTDCSGHFASLTHQEVLFCTNLVSTPLAITTPTMGIINQINLGLWENPNVPLNSYSTDPYAGQDTESAIDGFRYNMLPDGQNSPMFSKDFGKTFYKSNIFYAPLAPNRPIYVTTTWQANDPLVHYTVADLTDLSIPATNQVSFQSQPLGSIGQPNPRYEPWGGNPFGSRSNPTMPAYEAGAKDPFPISRNIIPRPDMWEFPTNKYPNVGWMGRVHRGTPWQTVFLKSRNLAPVLVLPNGRFSPGFVAWEAWSGDALWVTNFGQLSTNICQIYNPYNPTNWAFSRVPDAIFSLPTNDWRILDLFTTTVNANSERGRLSINQTNLASWSAVLSGVNVLPSLTNTTYIPPAGAYNFPTGLVAIVNGIINTRTNFPNLYYQRLGDVLATPELTMASPYLTTTNLVNDAMNDEVVERIPQQILGLLKGGEQPRYVIYSFGQALKPATHSVLPNGPFFGLCTNYQITAEVATRAVVRIDNATPVPGRPYNPHAVIENFNVLPPD